MLTIFCFPFKCIFTIFVGVATVIVCCPRSSAKTQMTYTVPKCVVWRRVKDKFNPTEKSVEAISLPKPVTDVANHNPELVTERLLVGNENQGLITYMEMCS